MRKLLKSKKALSPVVAAIILIAVTVAVSIAVAAWMGSLTMNFMETKELTVSQLTFDDDAETIVCSITNSGTSDVTVSLVKVNGVTETGITGTTDYEPGDQATLTITITDVEAGNKYAVNLFTAEGTLVGSYTDTA